MLMNIPHTSDPQVNIGIIVESNSLKAASGGSHFNLNLLFKAKIAFIPLDDSFVNVGIKLPLAVMLIPNM